MRREDLRRRVGILLGAVLAAAVAVAGAAAAQGGGGGREEGAFPSAPLHPGIFPNDWVEDFLRAMRSGAIPDRRARHLPPAPPRTRPVGRPGCVSAAQFFPFEDTERLLLSNFSTAALLNLMDDAGEALVAAQGDNFDFIGYWVNFTPHHTVGAAFYSSIENDVTGLGLPLFNRRDITITNSENVQGVIMMWNINSSFWQPGDGAGADFTRLVLGQEFEHRFAMFLPDLLDGRRIQGDNVCGRAGHWNFHVDGQGSSMEIIEWVGENPATTSQQSPLSFNTDIPGGVWSYTDLYLMGYVTPEEMDAGNSELRYMDEWTCMEPVYFGPISDFSSADIIAAAGPRIPGAATAQRDFRTGWIIIHLPGDEPDEAELEKAAGILNQRTIDWNHSTLGRGTMDDTIFDDCNCNGTPDEDDIASGASEDVNGNGIPDECEPDCNGNGRFDECDIAEGTSQDCNLNGIPDECDIDGGGSADCNANGIPDECEVLAAEEVDSGELGPIGAGSSQSFLLPSPPEALADVRLGFTARADLDEPTEWINVFLNNTLLGRVFVTGATECADEPDRDRIIVSGAVFNFLVDGGDAFFKLTASAEVNAAACGGESFVTISVAVPVPGPDDVNGNGVPDGCECLGDLDGSGEVDFTDVLAVLAAWGPCPPEGACPEDIDGNGQVDFREVLIVLTDWGPCP